MAGLPPYERDVNTVFQDYALFPHMSVGENVAYGLMIKKVPPAERERRVDEMLELVRLPGLSRAAAVAAFGRAAPAGGAGAGAGELTRACCCWTSRWARWISSCANRCRSS